VCSSTGSIEPNRKTSEWFFHDAASSQSKERIRKAVEFSDEVQQEDIGLCESVQRGLRSATYDRGRYSVRRENGVHHFHTLLGEFLERSSDV
jgi:choline monooxygenase